MEVIPKEVAYAAAKLDSFSRNKFRIETSGATSAGPSSIVTINLPDACVLDLRSFAVHMDVLSTKGTDHATSGKVGAKLPHSSDLIANMEVYVAGIMVQQGVAEYNTVTRMFKIPSTSFDRRHSVDALLHNGVMSDVATADDRSLVFRPELGFFAESSTRYLSCSLTGPISVRLTFASTSVLTPKATGIEIGAALTHDDDRTLAASLTYSVSNIFATVDSIGMGDAYDQMLSARLQTEDYLPINYKSYYSYSMANQTGNHTMRFSLSSTSIDTCLAVTRYANYQTPGIIGRRTVGAAFAEASIPNHFYFHSFSGGAAVTNKYKVGNLRYNWTVNGIRHPQFDADLLTAAADLSLVGDKMTLDRPGHSVTSLSHYQTGMCVIPLTLNLPGNALNLRTGYNTRGTNCNMELELKGLELPAATPTTTGVTDQLSTFVVAQATSQLRIGGNRQIAVDH